MISGTIHKLTPLHFPIFFCFSSLLPVTFFLPHVSRIVFSPNCKFTCTRQPPPPGLHVRKHRSAVATPPSFVGSTAWPTSKHAVTHLQPPPTFIFSSLPPSQSTTSNPPHRLTQIHASIFIPCPSWVEQWKHSSNLSKPASPRSCAHLSFFFLPPASSPMPCKLSRGNSSPPFVAQPHFSPLLF